MSDYATLDISDRVATLTLNRPDVRNALSMGLLDAMHERLDELAKMCSDTGAGNEPITVLVVTGAGKSFCAGMDLREVLNDEQMPQRLLTSLSQLTLKLRALPVVTVAKVNGAAIGGGCGLATVCDLAVTHADAKVGFPAVDLGLCPAVVAPWLVRKIGAGRARAVLLRGGVMTGQQAQDRGIVDALAADRGTLDATADELVSTIAGSGVEALSATKGLLNELDGSMDEALALRAAELSARVFNSPEAQAVLREKFPS